MKKYHLATPDATFAFGERIGRGARGGLVLALRGGLGAGKTVLAKGVARGLGVEDEVTSPSYTIISEYEGRLRFHHVDAWRLADADEFEAVGGLDLLADQGGVSVIEWSENIEELLPADAIAIDLQVQDDDSRLALVAEPLPEGWLEP